MKKMILTLSLALSSFCAQAYNPALDPAIKNIEACLASSRTLICNEEIKTIVSGLSMDVRGEFAMFLREELKANSTELVIKNLYSKLGDLVSLYEKLDTNDQWSFRAIKTFQDDVSIEFVKVAPIDSSFLVKLYKNQGTIGGRYGLLTTLNAKIAGLSSLTEMESLIRFLEVAKEYSRSIGDESYLYNTAVQMIGTVTVKETAMRPGHEGIFALTFDNAEAAKSLGIDKVVVMESNSRDQLIVNFVASQSRIVKMSFTSAAMLGNTLFSNMDTYNNNQDAANPFFKFDLNRETNTIKGVFSTARYGVMSFHGTLITSNVSVYALETVKGLALEQLMGSYKVKVGNYDMNLVIRKRTEDRTVVEAALFSDNAMISFSKVSLNSSKGVLSLVDYNNERKLTLAIVSMENGPEFRGQFLNALQSKVLEISSK